MREKPILFSTEMVQAILDGRKTMTRRIVKPQPPDEAKTLCGPKTYEPIAIDKDGEMYPGSPIYGAYDENGEWGTKCPYQPGDHLYVRETWADNTPGCPNEITYKADHLDPKGDGPANPIKWKSPRFMPKEAARIWLEVTNVRVERLQEINNADRLKEGIRVTAATAEELMNDYEAAEMGRQKFIKLWNSTIKKQDLLKYGWEANPWVFVIEFKRVNHD